MNNKNEPPACMLLNPQPGREATMQFVVALTVHTSYSPGSGYTNNGLYIDRLWLLKWVVIIFIQRDYRYIQHYNLQGVTLSNDWLLVGNGLVTDLCNLLYYIQWKYFLDDHFSYMWAKGITSCISRILVLKHLYLWNHNSYELQTWHENSSIILHLL